MEVGAVKKQIKDKMLEHFYIFTGDEITAQNIYIHKMAEVAGLDIQRIDSVSEVYKKQKSLFSKSHCFVCRDDKEFMKAEKAWDTIESVLGDNMLIFLMTEVDKRTKFYKHFSDTIVQFDYMKRESLCKYILREINLSDYWCNVLIDVCESDYGKILLEIDKIKQCMAYNGHDAYAMKCDSVLSDLLEQKAIHIPPQDAIFDFTDAVMKNQSEVAFNLLEECKEIGEPALRLILVLYNNVKKLLQVQACESKDISNATGLSAWDIKCVSDKQGHWSNGDLVYILKLLRNVEKGIKTGAIEESVAMDYIMINIFR